MTKSTTIAYSADVRTLPQSTTELIVTIPWEAVATFEAPIITRLATNMEMAGFRKGKVPESVARTHIPEATLLTEMAEAAIQSIYPKLLEEKSVDAIGRPQIQVTKLARNNPLEVTITTAVVPAITLPDYKNAVHVPLEPAQEVTEAAIEKVVHDLQEMRAYGHVHGQGDTHTHDQPLPEADDTFAQSFGNFKTMEELRGKIRENLTLEAAQAARDKRRVALLEAILAETSFEVPEVLIDSETQKLFAQVEADVAKSGLSIEDYLSHIKKSREELLKEFRPDAEKHARVQLLLHAIAKAAGIRPTDAEVEAETQKYMAMYPSADPERTRAYADMILTNEKVLAHIEEKK
ncbi:MAG TPA: trigger factor [Candidatus Paceibacterota bacterium]|nr:trigger factor [Candidatus Paceibacterota bacterium]